MAIVAKYLFLFILVGFSHLALAQREDAGDYDYDREVLFGVNKNTNGGLIGGVNLKIGTRINEDLFQFFALEFVNVK
ncbi:MAG TPA: hypothetical protein VK921_12165, partial [Anditalea sp.]|nr:hypothetical protein [Anditalea sp.]